MKIAIVGKGGSGKSTVTSLLAGSLVRKGFRILVVDADESNVGLSRMLGMKEPTDLMDVLGGRAEVSRRLKAAKDKKAGTKLFDGGWGIDDLPADYATTKGRLSLLQIGKVNEFEEGCACVMGVLSREFLNSVKTKEGELVLVDTEAGVEHMGRGLEKEVDLILAIIDPSMESIRLLERIKKMAKEADKPLAAVLNRVDPKVERVMRMAGKDTEIAAAIGYNEEVLLAGLDGESVPSGLNGEERLSRYVVSRIEIMSRA